jgi:hypothetical protein
MMFQGMLVLGWLSLAQVPPAPPSVPGPPPVPVPAPAATAPAAPSTPSAPEAPAAPTTAPEPPKYEFTLGARNECNSPCYHGSAKAADGKIELTPEDNVLKAVLGGAAGANVFLGTESTATLTLHVVQEFDVTCTDPAIDQVVLTLESSLKGFIRSKHKASACVRVASATIAPVGAADTPLAVTYPALCVGGVQCCNGGPHGYKYENPADPVKTPPMPLGRYVLQADFVIQTTAAGLLDAHSTAIFIPESEDLDAWEREHDPFKGDSHDDFGFTLTLKADTPPGKPPVAHKKPARRVTTRTRAAATAAATR